MIYAGPVYTSRAFPINIILTCDKNDNTVLALVIVEKSIQKAEKES